MVDVIDKTKSLELIRAVLDEVKKVIKGKDDVVLRVLLAIISGGHILIEDVPGVGKTTLAVSLAKSLSLAFKRIQFTPDVLASDVTGCNIFDRQTGSFVFTPGAVFCNLLLADELNRTSGKTQSALLEVMEEGQVTVDGVTKKLPEPFTVIATQNPAGTIGTALLPESQLDRFMIRLRIGYPQKEDEIAILKNTDKKCIDEVNAIASIEDLNSLRAQAAKIFVDDKIYSYISDLAAFTRESDAFSLGLSPRGAQAVLSMAKASALCDGRDFVLPEDIKNFWEDVSSHRVIISKKSQNAGKTARNAVIDVLNAVSPPKI
ncbi:MAG: MoxR family ATPase [Ruminococcus sp.]|jgi:MoxR-like ATPase|nr:MoxR family ATPase [Ruminococcus sp.]